MTDQLVPPESLSGPRLDQWWREVATSALLGTARRPVPPLPDLGAVGVRPRANPVGAEQSLLEAAALGAALVQYGSRLASAERPDQAPEDRQPVAPPRAVQLLELVLTQPPVGAQQHTQLMAHWLRTADAAGCRVPHRLLPRLLELASANRELRPPTAMVADERGRWLAAQRTSWAWLGRAPSASSGESGPARQRTPSLQEWRRWPASRRVATIGLVRTRDPSAGRELLAATWTTDGARDRRDQLEALRIGLGPEDEVLLEQALDDRATAVRELSAELLDALPSSARAARMAVRLRALVRRSGLLGRSLDVELPGEPDAAAIRDGLGGAPPQRSARGWWLEQICAGAPLEVWTEISRVDPSATVRRVTDADVLLGLRRAVRARRAQAWAAPLLSRGFDPGLVPVLPRESRERVVLDRIEASTERAWEAESLLGTIDPPWSNGFSVALVRRLRASPIGSAMLAAAMPALAAGLHPAALEGLQGWLDAVNSRADSRPVDPVGQHRTETDRRLGSNLRNLLQLHSVQQSITEAFR